MDGTQVHSKSEKALTPAIAGAARQAQVEAATKQTEKLPEEPTTDPSS
jgi:hypothetical protein